MSAANCEDMKSQIFFDGLIEKYLPEKLVKLYDKIKHFIPVAMLIGMGRLFFLLLFFVLARFTFGDSFGLFTVVFALSQLTGIACMFGTGPTASVVIPQAIERGRNSRVARYLKFSFYTTALGVITMVLFCFILEYSFSIFNWREGQRIIEGLMFFGPIMAVSMLREFLARAFERPVLAFLPRDICWCVLLMACVAFIPSFRFDIIISAAIVLLFVEICAWLVFWRQELRHFTSIKYKGKIWVKEWKNRSFALLMNYLGGLGFERVDVIAVGLLGGLNLAAIYSVANRIAPLISMSQRFIVPVLSPRISRAFASKDTSKVQKEVFSGLTFSLLYAGTFFVFVMLFAEDLMGMFGPEFIIGANILRILAFAHLMIALGSNFGVILLVGPTPWVYARTIWFALIFAIIALTFAIPASGLEGAAIVVVIGIAFYNIANGVFAKNSLDKMKSSE